MRSTSTCVPGKALLLVGVMHAAGRVEQPWQVLSPAPIVNADACHQPDLQVRGLAAQPMPQCARSGRIDDNDFLQHDDQRGPAGSEVGALPVILRPYALGGL